MPKDMKLKLGDSTFTTNSHQEPIMNIAFNPKASIAHPFFWLALKSLVRPTRVTIIPAVGDMQSLQKGATLAVDKPLYCEVVCLQGALWITHDGDTRDIVLEAGQHYAVDCAARMLVHALDSARIRLT